MYFIAAVMARWSWLRFLRQFPHPPDCLGADFGSRPNNQACSPQLVEPDNYRQIKCGPAFAVFASSRCTMGA
jgi:hypothetical protein